MSHGGEGGREEPCASSPWLGRGWGQDWVEVRYLESYLVLLPAWKPHPGPHPPQEMPSRGQGTRCTEEAGGRGRREYPSRGAERRHTGPGSLPVWGRTHTEDVIHPSEFPRSLSSSWQVTHAPV